MQQKYRDAKGSPLVVPPLPFQGKKLVSNYSKCAGGHDLFI